MALDRNHSVSSVPPEVEGAAGIAVEALKRLGGIASLPDLYAMIGTRLDRIMTRNTLQQHSSQTGREQLASADVLFYNAREVDASVDIWGLCGFAPQMPTAYPLADLLRPYTRLLKRVETPLTLPRRGIAYKNGRVCAIQVSFTAHGSSPDTLDPDGTIHHIGEGLSSREQQPNAGNGGILKAIETGDPIPILQFVAPNRYAPLGDYRAIRSYRKMFKFEKNEFETNAFVFVLQPLVEAADLKILDSEVNELIRESGKSPKVLKPEGRRALRMHLAAERSPGNRVAALRIKGYRCEVCGFHFGERYGPEIDGYAEVHHTRPIGAGEYTPDLETDFAVLCANCHRAAHKGRGLDPRSIEELRGLLR